MRKFLGAGRASAVSATCLLAMAGPSGALAQTLPTGAAASISYQLPAPTPALSDGKLPVTNAVLQLPATKAVAPAVTAPTQEPNLKGWPLYALVEAYKQGEPLDPELNCVAVAVYFEARGEPLEGQLAVAEVVQNRARSGKYPSSYCAVVKQPWQFSFVRKGQFPRIDESSPLWAKAQAIARIAAKQLADELPDDVLWYHANYVSPSWGRRLSRVEQIGAHIFYRA